jgi:hypothetical protein
MAMTMTPAACVRRLAKLPGVKNEELMLVKTMQRATKPSTAGSEPISPDLIRAQ